MANRGRQYAEGLVGSLDRSAYNPQREVAQNVYNTNWQNVQNQYRNLQDKLKLQQQRANAEYAEGLVNAAENSFNRQRTASGNLANRGLTVSGLTNMLNQADIAQKGEDIRNLLKRAGGTSLETADKLSQATNKFAEEGTGLMQKLSNTLADIGDSETSLQNKYNATLANIAAAMDEREANNEIQAMQRALSRASNRASSSGGKNKELSKLENDLAEFQKRVTINDIITNKELTDQQKSNYLGVIFGIKNAGDVINASNRNANATANYNKNLAKLKDAASAEAKRNALEIQKTQDWLSRQPKLQNISNENLSWGGRAAKADIINTLNNLKRTPYTGISYSDAIALNDFKKKGPYEDLATLLYGNK